MFFKKSGEWMLSEMKRFGEIAHMKKIDFIKAKLINIKETSLGIWQSFSITHEDKEANHQKAESSLTKSQILSIIIINSLNPF